MILVIDDDKDFITVTKMILVREGYEVIAARTITEINQIFANLQNNPNHQINLALLDLMMPDITGEEIFLRLRNHEYTADIPVIVFSAVNKIDKRVELLDLGVEDYLIKPCPIDELLARVAIHVQLGQLRKAKQEADVRIASQARYLQAINAIGNQASQHLELEKMMEIVTAGIIQRFECAACHIYLQDTESETLHLISYLPNTDDISAEAKATAQYQTTTIEGNHVYIPITRNDVTLGILHVVESEQTTNLEDKIHSLETLSVQLGTSITNAHLFQDIRQRNSDLRSIAQENRELYEAQAKLLKEREFSQAQLIQSEKMAVAGRLAASMAHEINNPLQAIHSCLQLTTQFDLGRDKQMEYLLMAEEEVERLMSITDRILDFSRPSSREYELCNITRIINQVMNLASKHLSHQKLSVKQIIDSDIAQIYVIPDQITQVFLQIILNAIDATPERGELLIRTTLENQWVKTSFKDTGIGISPEVQQHIFEPFYTTKETNSGLGLTIGYGIIERHGGKIEVNSTVDVGTEVTVYLPYSQEPRPM